MPKRTPSVHSIITRTPAGDLEVQMYFEQSRVRHERQILFLTSGESLVAGSKQKASGVVSARWRFRTTVAQALRVIKSFGAEVEDA